MECYRIGKMPHHLRRLANATEHTTGRFQYQTRNPGHLQETVADVLGHKTLTEKEKEKGRTVPFVA